MIIQTKLKRGASMSWCHHTDNAFGGPGRINVRAGKRILRKKLKNLLKKIQHEYTR